jgi:hypothetical protein
MSSLYYQDTIQSTRTAQDALFLQQLQQLGRWEKENGVRWSVAVLKILEH